MPKSLLDLSFEYIDKSFPDKEPSQDEKWDGVDEVTDLLAAGYTEAEISLCIANLPKEVVLGKSLRNALRGVKPKSYNLLAQDRFYLHSELHVLPPPPKLVLDYNTGKLKREEQEWFLEMRASYTLDDLFAYYAKQMGLSPTPTEARRFQGGLKWLTANFDIDEILFTIDAAANNIQAEDMPPLSNATQILEHYPQAKEAMVRKATELKLSGGYTIAPRKRVLTSRRRSSSEE